MFYCAHFYTQDSENIIIDLVLSRSSFSETLGISWGEEGAGAIGQCARYWNAGLSFLFQ